MLSVLEIVRKTTDFLAGRGIESPRLNAELIIGHALGLKRMQLYLQFERLLEERELEAIRPLVRRRAQQEPLQYVLGDTEFCGLTLKVDSRVLIPRPETERLVELTLERCPVPPASILDLGTGSGAIALALAQAFPAAAVTAVDRDEGALELARENALSTGLSERVRLVQSDWFAGVPLTPFDLVISNPPYLSSEELALVPREVREFEPSGALVAPNEGMADLRTIISGAAAYVAAGGLLALETGEAQHPFLLPCLAAAGFSEVESLKDLAGRPRFLIGRR